MSSVAVGGSAYHTERLHCGDCLLQVNGQSVSILSDDQLENLISVRLASHLHKHLDTSLTNHVVQGPEGTFVSLLVRTPTKNILEVRLVRTLPEEDVVGVRPEKTGFATADGWDENDQGLDGFNNESVEIIGVPSTAPAHRQGASGPMSGPRSEGPRSGGMVQEERTVERMMA